MQLRLDDLEYIIERLDYQQNMIIECMTDNRMLSCKVDRLKSQILKTQISHLAYCSVFLIACIVASFLGGCSDECTDNEFICDGNTVMQCWDGEFEVHTNCDKVYDMDEPEKLFTCCEFDDFASCFEEGQCDDN